MEKIKKPTQAFDATDVETNHQKGWTGGLPVGIESDQWPRSRNNGFPMAHLFTVWVPEEYRTKGKDLVAISLFQADDHVAKKIAGVREAIEKKDLSSAQQGNPFWDGLVRYIEKRHRQEVYMEDLIDGGWALIWLTENEFSSTETQAPSKDSMPAEYESADGMNAYRAQSRSYIDFEVRKNDPNIGKDVPLDVDDDDLEEDDTLYIPMHSEKGESLELEQFSKANHFGGTANPANPPFGDDGELLVSAFYFEFEEDFGGANFGGGNGQLDLLHDKIEWSQ